MTMIETKKYALTASRPCIVNLASGGTLAIGVAGIPIEVMLTDAEAEQLKVEGFAVELAAVYRKTTKKQKRGDAEAEPPQTEVEE
jgi:hypothetical protein